jgi:NADH-quinone oxidoreductase subunit H
MEIKPSEKIRVRLESFNKSLIARNLSTVTVATLSIAFASNFQLWDLNIGVLYVTAISSLMVISILMAGWASNNKYSLMGAMRSGAQIVSYELSAGLSIMSIVVLSGSLNLNEIIKSQADGWWLFKGHIPVVIAFIIFIIAVTAETNRAPFDLAEAESELTAGFHTEYSGMKFALFFLAEYINIFIVCAIVVKHNEIKAIGNKKRFIFWFFFEL